MVTGLIPPTSGEAIVRGKSIKSEMDQIRQSMGVCPQHDVLFPELNVRQHLEVFAAFKNVPHSDIPNAVDEMIARVGLKEKAQVKSAMLSGGQKRKLSVGIALIGDSKCVILDEPVRNPRAAFAHPGSLAADTSVWLCRAPGWIRTRAGPCGTCSKRQS